MIDHSNSKKITIFRSGSFLSRAQGKDIAHYFDDAKVAVGSYYESKNSQKIASGLDFDEERLLLPTIIDIPADDKEFRKAVSTFYKEINTNIPAITGCILEIGLLSDNAKPVSEKNMPISIMDYLRYRHAKEHPFMGASKEIALGNALKQYYIFDPEELKVKSNKKILSQDQAMQIYLTVKQEIDKVDMLLTLLGVDIRDFTGKDADALKIEALRKKAEEDADSFIARYKEDDMEIRYWIEAMKTTGVLKVAGAKYYNAENNDLLGNSLEETIFFFKDTANSQTVVLLKGLFQEAKKKIPSKQVKRTQAIKGRELNKTV